MVNDSPYIYGLIGCFRSKLSHFCLPSISFTYFITFYVFTCLDYIIATVFLAIINKEVKSIYELKHPCVEKKLDLTNDILSANQAKNELASHFQEEEISSPSNTKTGMVPAN